MDEMETEENRKNSEESRGHDENGEDQNKNENPRPSQRKIIPTKKAEKVCQYCNRNFSQKSDFENHVKKCKRFFPFVRGENSNVCSLCPETREFSSQGYLFVHLEKSHASQLGPAKEKKPETKICEYCEVEVQHRSYTAHVTACRKYKGMIKGDQCLVCQKVYPKSRSNLLTHMKKHLESNPRIFGMTQIAEKTKPPKEKPAQKFPILENLECPNCQALFRNEDSLAEHIETCSAVNGLDGFGPPDRQNQEEEDEDDPLSSSTTPSITKQCTFCTQEVPKGVLGKHLKRCSKAADLIRGLKCTQCPHLQLESKRDMYDHVLKNHIPEDDNDDEITTQDGMDEVMTIEEPEEIPRNISRADRKETQAHGPTITEVNETPRQPTFRGETAIVPRDYFVDVDPNIITKLYVCPLCKGKLARMDHVQKHVVLFHKIDFSLFRNLNIQFTTFPV